MIAIFSRLPLGLFLETPPNFSTEILRAAKARPSDRPPEATPVEPCGPLGRFRHPRVGAQRNSVGVPEIVSNRADARKRQSLRLFLELKIPLTVSGRRRELSLRLVVLTSRSTLSGADCRVWPRTRW